MRAALLRLLDITVRSVGASAEDAVCGLLHPSNTQVLEGWLCLHAPGTGW